MKTLHSTIITFACCFLSNLTTYGQKHYVVEINRITTAQNYALMELVNGRPIEKAIPKPILEKNDILTIRLTNFNELIYGLEVKPDYLEKKNVMEQLTRGNPLFDQLPLATTVQSLLDILAKAPTFRGEEKSGVSLSSVRKSYVGLLTKIKLMEDELSIVYDEGATLPEIKKVVHRIKEAYNPKEIQTELNEIKKNVDVLKLNEEESTLLEDISEGVEALEESAANDYLQPRYNLRNLNKVINEVDFIQEKTIVIDEEPGDYDKFLAYLFIYKRGNEITSVSKITKKPYEFTNDGEDDGDFLRQSLLVDLKFRDSKKPFWTIGIYHISFPKNIYSYRVDKNFREDSVRVLSDRIGGGRLAFGTDFNFRLPINSEYVSTSVSLGLAMAFSNALNKKACSSDNTQAFITTGLGISLIKLSNISLKLGMVWPKFQQQSKQYKTNVWYEGNTFSEDDLDNIYPKKVKPSLMIGICLKL